MIFAVTGFFREPASSRGSGFEAAINEQLAQPFVRIVHAGYLHDSAGSRIGVLALIDVETFARAESFLGGDPYQRAGDFERALVAEYQVEVGRLG